MNEEMRIEAMELCVTACEKHANSNEVSVYYTVYYTFVINLWFYKTVFDIHCFIK